MSRYVSSRAHQRNREDRGTLNLTGLAIRPGARSKACPPIASLAWALEARKSPHRPRHWRMTLQWLASLTTPADAFRCPLGRGLVDCAGLRWTALETLHACGVPRASLAIDTRRQHHRRGKNSPDPLDCSSVKSFFFFLPSFHSLEYLCRPTVFPSIPV